MSEEYFNDISISGSDTVMEELEVIDPPEDSETVVEEEEEDSDEEPPLRVMDWRASFVTC